MANEINLFSEIGPGYVTAQTIKAELATASQAEELRVRIDSEGGSVFEGFSIYSAFRAYEGPKVCSIESAAFSIASYIAMAFDRVEITRNGYMMIHNPSAATQGDDEELARQAGLLAKLKASMVEAYSEKTNIAPEVIEDMMRKETYLDAEEALAAGFVDAIVDYSARSRVVAAKRQKDNVPFRVVASLNGEGSDAAVHSKEVEEVAKESTPATVKQIKAKFPKAKSDFIVRAMEQEMAMDEITEKLVEELTSENEQLMASNEELMAKLTAMEEESPSAMEDETTAKAEEDEKVYAMEDEEEEPSAKSATKARSGVKPLARVSGGRKQVSARSEWTAAIETYVAKGLDRVTATRRANAANPGLRERMLQELQAN